MRRIVFIILAFFIAFTNISVNAMQPVMKQEIKAVSNDGFNISATLTYPKTKQKEFATVVLLHSLGYNSQWWSDLPKDLLEKGYIPVISTIGCDDDGNSYNINGDTAAARIAGALRAARLIMMTDIDGILRDKDDPSTLIPEMTISGAKKLYQDGIISGGMIPKVDCCIEAINEGVKNVTIINGKVPHAILMEILTNEGAGTMVTGD